LVVRAIPQILMLSLSKHEAEAITIERSDSAHIKKGGY
jgi:hypothetical protein